MKSIIDQAKEALPIIQAIINKSSRVRIFGHHTTFQENARSLDHFLETYTLEPLTFGDPPKGRKWHNPLNLTPEQVEVDKGWRLCCETEMEEIRFQRCTFDNHGAVFWIQESLLSSRFSNPMYAYRTMAPLPPSLDVMELTVAQIEKKLGCKVKIVGNNETTNSNT